MSLAPDPKLPVESYASQLVAALGSFPKVVVAFSGGVDSSVVAAAAHLALGPEAVAVTADSPSLSRHLLEQAKQVAGEIGIRHQVIHTNELEKDAYRRNEGDRCFYCKQTLYETLGTIVSAHAGATIVSGTNADDLHDYRPGIEAGRMAGVVTPLADLGLGKSVVRALAQHWGLSVHDSPASPCLSSRLAYGVEVTIERLCRVESAEMWLRDRGFSDVRVRLHADELARLEIHPDQRIDFLKSDLLDELSHHFRELGFKFVTFDLEGRRSGSLNRALFAISPPVE